MEMFIMEKSIQSYINMAKDTSSSEMATNMLDTFFKDPSLALGLSIMKRK
jgi:hypothetical protein